MKTVRDIEIELDYLDSITKPSTLEKNRRIYLNKWRNKMKAAGETQLPVDFEDYIDAELAYRAEAAYESQPVRTFYDYFEPDVVEFAGEEISEEVI